MLLDDGSPQLIYQFNRASHSECSQKFKDCDHKGVNATGWQVACGVYVALELLPLLKPKGYSMTAIVPDFVDDIAQIFSNVQFQIECQKIHRDEISWENVEKFFTTFQKPIQI